MSDNHIFPVSNGLFEHRDRIGPAIWEFLWCIDRISAEEIDDQGQRWGLVLNGIPIKHERIATEIGSSERTVKRNLSRLKDENYIITTRAPYGEIIKVSKNKKNVSKSRSAKNVPSEQTEVPNMAYLHDKNGLSEPRDVPHLSERSATNGPSNKDFNKDFNISSSSDDNAQVSIDSSSIREIENYFVTKRNSGLQINMDDFNAIRQTIADGIPVETIKAAIDKAFANHKPKHRHDKIRTFTYCVPGIYDFWVKEKAITEPLEPVALGSSITENVPSEPVALGPTQKKYTRYGNRQTSGKPKIPVIQHRSSEQKMTDDQLRNLCKRTRMLDGLPAPSEQEIQEFIRRFKGA